MDLIRDILLAVEVSDRDPRGWIDLAIPDRDPKEVAYHVKLLDEAGLLVAQNLCTLGPNGFDWRPKCLTWNGHEFLDAARDEGIWKQAKAKLSDIGGSSALAVVQAILTKLAMQAVGLEA
jgi:hypothetical protein